MKAITVTAILFAWLTLTLLFLILIFVFKPEIGGGKGINLFIASSSRNIYQAENTPEGRLDVLAAVKASDTRVLLVNRFLEKYGSPMAGHGAEFVAAADKHGLDWRLLPALAFQESTLGKNIPKGSHNPFGWAIYEGANSGVYFESWSEAINIVATGVKRDYVSQGLVSPEAIVNRYTSNNNASWVFAVRGAMEELSATEY